jgi:hypothetical protein
MGGGGGSSNPYTWTEIRYAPYIEARHSDFLNTVYSARVRAISNSPFAGYTDIEVDNAFFGAGYTISSFPSLYDMYGKFMAGLDIEALWTQEYNDTINSPVVNALIAAEGDLIDDEIETTSLPRLQTGMRDMNAVMSSSFVVGKSLIEDTRTKTIAKFSADLKYRLVPIAQERWNTHLNWNKLVIGTYAEIMKLYFSAKTDVDEINYAMAAKNTLWPFTVLDFERAAVGALQGSTTSKQDVAGASTASRVLSGALSGAAMGAQVGASIGSGVNVVKDTAGNVISNSAGAGAGYGAVAGAVMGGLAAYLY